MGFWNDVSRFAGNLTGGFIGESDEERRRKQQQQARVAAARPSMLRPGVSYTPSAARVNQVAQPNRPQTAPQRRPGVPQTFAPKAINPLQKTEEEEEEDTLGFNVLAEGSALRQKQVQPQSLGYVEKDDTTKAPSVVTRQASIREGIKRNEDIRDIANRTGLAEGEVQSYVDTHAKGYKAKDFWGQAGDVVGAIGEGLATTVGAPIITMDRLNNRESVNRTIQNLDEEYKAGRISKARLQQEFDNMSKGFIGGKLKVTDKGVERKTAIEDIANFAGQFSETAVNIFPGASGVAAGVNQGAKQAFGALVKQSAKRAGIESGFTGTVGTAADAMQDRDITPESVLLNYGGDFLFNAGGELSVAGVKKMVANMKADPNVTPDMMKKVLTDTISADVTKKITPQELQSILEVKPKPNKKAAATLVSPEKRQELLAKLEQMRGGGSGRDSVQSTETAEALQAQERNVQIAAMPTPQYVARVVERFNLQPATTARLLNRVGGNKATLVKLLEDNADRIASADIPDAYATKIVNEAAAAGQSAAVRGGVATKRDLMPQETPEPTAAGAPAVKTGELPSPIERPVTDAPTASKQEEPTPDTTLEGLKNKPGTTPAQPKIDPERYQEMENGTITDTQTGEIVFDKGRFTVDPATLQTTVGSTPMSNPTMQKVPTPIQDAPVDNPVQQAPRPETPEGQGMSDTPTVAQQTRAEIQKAAEQETAVWEAIKETVHEQGFNFEDITRKMTMANRKQYNPTPEEMEVMRYIEDEFNSARAVLAEQGVEFDGQQSFYFPQRKAGTMKSVEDYTPSDMLDFGSSERRSNSLELDEIEYGADPAIEYTLKARHRELKIADGMAHAAETDGRTVTVEGVKAAAKRTIQLENKVKSAANTSEGVMKHDTVKELNAIGKDEGYEQVSNTTKIGMTAQEPKNILERAGVFNRGFEQYVNATGYASEFIRLVDNADGDAGAMLPSSLKKTFPQGDESSLGSIAAWAQRKLENASPDQRHGIVDAAFRMSAKAELTKLGKTTTFENKKLQKVVNEQMNRILVNDAYKRNAAQKLDNFVAHRINESLRGMNVVSAMFEASDIYNIMADFGVKNMKSSKVGFGKVDGKTFGMSERYGKANQHFLSDDLPQDADTILNGIWADPKTNIGQKVYQSARRVRDLTLLFKYVEKWKTELFLREADTFYRAKGLQGKELVDMVNAHFDKTMLPSTALTINRMLGKAPKSLTQYLSWGINSTKRLGRTFSGSNEYGKFADMGRAERVMRGVGTEIIPKVATAMAVGVPITQVLGGRDWLGVSTGDYSGVDEDDQTALDDIVNTMAMSPVLGMMANFYNGYRRQEEQKEENAKGGEQVEVDSKWAESAAWKSASMLVPYWSQGKKVYDVWEGQNRGYYTNRDGRIQYGAVGDGEAILGGITGKNLMPTAREYQDNPSLLSVVEGKASLADLATHNQTVDNVVQRVTKGTSRDYHRPLATSKYDNSYNEQAIAAYESIVKAEGKNSPKAKEAIRDWVALGRKYNRIYDEFKKKNPTGFDTWIKTMGDDVLTPEKWKMYQGNDDVFQFMKQRKQLEARDLGRVVDPIYGDSITDEQRKQILQQRSVFTGDDMRLQEFLYKSGPKDWYKEFKALESKYYDTFEGEQDTTGKSARFKEHKVLSDKLFKAKDQFGLMAESQKIINQYGFGSPESKAWFKANSDAYQAQKLEYEKYRLDVVNQMRKLEGAGPLSHDEWMAKIDFPEQDEDGVWTGGKYGDSKWKNYSKGKGGRKGSSSGDTSVRTGVLDSLTNHSADNDGITEVKIAKNKMRNVRKAAKPYKRASSRSSIRIKL